MHTYFKGKDIGRISDHEVRIILPLIDSGIIRMKFYVCSYPLYASEFKPIHLKAKVYLNKKAITEPIVESYEPQ